MDAAALLLDELKPLPGTALVPVEWIRQRLEATAPPPEREAIVDLSCEEVAKQLGRKPSTIRGWAASGVLPRCYRLRGREYRIPQSSLAEFLARAQRQEEPEPEQAGSATPVDLGAWRRVKR